MGSTAADKHPGPPAELVERFRADLQALWPEGLRDAGARLGLAVSGGPDSTAMLLLAAAAFPGRIAAATVDHRLRPESAREAGDVAHLCAKLAVPHQVLEVDVASGNIQAEARNARYAAMAAWVEAEGLAALATGHHAEDQAETLLLRLNRASGAAGLAGTRARGRVPQTEIALLRPLLGWRRSELGDLLMHCGIEAAQDPNNRDEKYDRVRMRKALASADWLDIAAIAESAGHLADADAALEWAAQREWSECVRREGPGLVYQPRAPRAVALRVLSRIVSELDYSQPRGGAIARLFETLMTNSPASIGGLVARPGPEGWDFAPAPLRKAPKQSQTS
ncbi:MAG: tRNA lysidine(34) synthetase TilS [Novosphingobium sp.]|nr:tRNA lysidine(34) synthetase TilS [Novosphingobium sp.]